MISHKVHKYSNPSVSVLMTIYNAEPYLKEAIDSIIFQTFENWELIAIEHGSTDNSLALLSSYDDPRIHVFVYPENIGRTNALCKAFGQAQSEYIAILDADDISHPDRLAKQVKYLNENPEVGLVGSWAERIDKDSNIIANFNPPIEKTQLYNSLGWTNPFVHSSIMYRKYLAQKVGGYPKNYIYAQDYALTLNLLKVCQVAIIDEYLCKLRILNSSMTFGNNEYNKIRSKESKLLFQRAAQDIPLSAMAYIRNRIKLAILNSKICLLYFKNVSSYISPGKPPSQQ